MKLLRFFARKLFEGGATLILAASISFLLARLAGDPTIQLLGLSATPDEITSLRALLGFDGTIWQQYLAFLQDLVRFDLGTSLYSGETNLSIIASRIWPSTQLALLAVVIGVALGLPMGIVAAAREGKLVDRVISAMAIVGMSIPAFWLGMILILFFAVNIELLPAGFSGGWQNLVLPTATLATIPLARVARLTRSAVSASLKANYVMAARARGVLEWRVLCIYALRNASLPIVTVIGLQFGTLLSGAVTVETVFAWPGLGSLALESVLLRDIPLIQALVIFGALVFIFINIVLDLIYVVLDPRVGTSQWK